MYSFFGRILQFPPKIRHFSEGAARGSEVRQRLVPSQLVKALRQLLTQRLHW